jgi:hypothetical protein
MKISIEQVEEFFSNRAMDVAEGMADPMDVYAELSRTEKLTEALKAAVKAEAMSKALEFGADKEKISYHGHSFQVRKGRSMYDFKHIGPWKAAEEEKKRVEELAKAAAKAQQEIADPETGEVIAPAIVTYASDSLIVSKD